jgi:PST family polysaccharide transporter
MSLFKLLKENINKPVAGNMGWQSISSFSRIAFAIISTALLTRYLGPEIFGQYSFVLAIAGIFILFNRGGSEIVSLSYLQKSPDQEGQIFGSILAWRLLCWVGGLIILIGSSYFLSGDKYIYILIIYLSLLFGLADTLDNFFQIIYQNKYYVISRTFTEGLAMVIKIYLVMNNYELKFFIYTIALQNIIYAIIIITAYKVSQGKLPKISFSLIWLKKIAKDSIPMFLAGFIMTFYMRIDQIMISHLMNDEALGYFAPSTQIVLAFMSLTTIFTQPMQVKLLEINKRDKNEYHNALSYYIGIITKLSYAIAIITCLTAWFLVPLAFGSEFSPTISIIMVQIWACVFGFQGAIRDREIVTQFKTSYTLLGAVLGTITNIIMNFILIPKYGAIGASIATIFSLAVTNYLTSWIIPDLRPFAKIQTKALFLMTPTLINFKSEDKKA